MSATDTCPLPLERFGYTSRQAAFLALVARHGGYFLRRQYVAFTGQSHGLVTVRFLRRLVERRHARTLSTLDGAVFHLSARPLYAALGEEHNRNRRRADWEAVSRKLLTVDFVLSHRHDTFYATETEKVSHLTHLRIGRELWPSRSYAARRAKGSATIRYFVDKMPWHRTQSEPELWFDYVDTEQSLAGFETFLSQYGPLFRTLTCGVTYVARAVDSRAVTALFTRVLARGSVLTPTRLDLVVYFRVRRDIEAGRAATLLPEERRRFIQFSSHFSVAFDDLYAMWPFLPDSETLETELRRRAPTKCRLRIHQMDVASAKS